MGETTKILVQCDFDGTITEKDVSFTLLDTFANGKWRERLKDYQDGKITVGRFNTEAFSLVKADRTSLVEAALRTVRIRPGFDDFLSYCQREGIRLVIVSNGLDFYIEEILSQIGAENIEFTAARTNFCPEGLDVRYIGPDGNLVEDDFKGAYLTSFLKAGYRVFYAGNGTSDLLPAKRCYHIFATGSLLTHCRRLNIECTPFESFQEIISKIEAIS